MLQQIQTLANKDCDYADLISLVSVLAAHDVVYRAGAISWKAGQFNRLVAYNGSSRVLNASIHEVLAEIDTWEEEISAHWKPANLRQTMPTPSRDQFIACVLALFRSSQVTFYLNILEFRESLNSTEPPTHNQTNGAMEFLEEHTKCLLADICSSISSALGEISAKGSFEPVDNCRPAVGYLLLWPMWIVANCWLSTIAQISYCRMALELCRISHGYRLAFSLLGRDLPGG
jgi:hypothetical protein